MPSTTPEVSFETARSETEVRTGARCNWGAVFSGSLFTLAIAGVLFFLSNALGLPVIQVVDSGTTAGLRIASWVFAFFTWAIAFFMGGFFSVRMGEVEGSRRVLYGLTTWALAGVLLVLLGGQESLLFRLLLSGDGPKEAHWLMFATAFVGAGVSIMGSLIGRTSARQISQRDYTRRELRKA